jgi:hypothetical protein
MQRLILIQATATNPEIAVLKASADEHKILHDPNQGKDFVNKNHVFTKDVTDLTIASHAAAAGDWIIVAAHPPACCSKAVCLSIPNGSR